MTQATGIGRTRTSRASVAFWVTLARASLAVALGLALLLQPDKTRPMLANFIGGFWLAAGVMSLRWSASGEHPRRASRIAGVVGVIAGLLVLGRAYTARVVSVSVGVTLIGVIAILTGVFHVTGGFERAHEPTRHLPWTSIILGIFEIVLGIVVLTSSTDFGTFSYLVAAGWAFTGAAMLLGDALRQRRQRRSPGSA